MFKFAYTDPPKVVNVTASKYVQVQESVSLLCEAEGNPQPTFSWKPCDQPQCNKRTLVVSEVLYDVVYICNATNSLGSNSGNVSVCKLQKNYLQLTYSRWDVYVVLY